MRAGTNGEAFALCRLVLEMFTVFMQITDPRKEAREVLVRGRTVAVKGKARFTATRKVVSTTFAPHIFSVALFSLAQVQAIQFPHTF